MNGCFLASLLWLENIWRGCLADKIGFEYATRIVLVAAYPQARRIRTRDTDVHRGTGPPNWAPDKIGRSLPILADILVESVVASSGMEPLK